MASTSELRNRIGRIGAWVGSFTVAPAAQARPAAAEIDRLGYGTLWYPEGLGTRESFSNGAVLLAATQRITIASGIANIWGRDAVSSASAARVLADAFDDRFLLGLGVSHKRQVDPRGHAYGKPVATMRAYLDALDDDPYVSPDHGSEAARPPVSRVIAALRPPMLELAAERAQGAHTYLVPVEHTARARELMGKDALLIVEQKAVVGVDRSEALARARTALSWYLETPNYRKNLEWLGFSEADIDAAAEPLVDALVAIGEDAVKARVEEHLQAGADQVAIQPLGAADDLFGLEVLRALAPVLLG